MIYALESIAKFIEGKVATDLVGITTPEMRFLVRASVQPPEFPNCLNLYFFDHSNKNGSQYDPHWREVSASLELLIAVDPVNPLVSEQQASDVMHKINQFMAVQSTPKMNYSVNPAVSLKTSIQWRDFYPLEWISAPNVDERYIHKSCFLAFTYFEERVVA